MKKKRTKSENELSVHNELITNNLNLDLYQARIVAFLATTIFKSDTEFKFVKTNLKELLEITKLESGEHYKELRETLENLRKKDVRIRKTHSILETGFLSSVEYFDNGDIEIKFDDKLKPYYLELGGNFTTFQLEILLQFSSFYALKIYELCKMILGKHKGILEVEIQELREILGIKEDIYKQYSHFRERVLDVAEEKINKNTDIKINIEPTTKRNIKSLIFTVKQNYSYINPSIENKGKTEVSKKAEESIIKKRLKQEKEEEEKKNKEQEQNKIFNEKALEIFKKMTIDEKEKYRNDFENLNKRLKKSSFNNCFNKFVFEKVKEKFWR